MEKEKKTRILAVDFGFARIGIAISDEQKIIARSLETIAGSKNLTKAADNLLLLIHKLKREAGYEIVEIVVGLPLKMNGTESERTSACREFAKLLQEKISQLCISHEILPVILWDERLTTVQAERSLKEACLSRKKRAGLVDGVSAVILLQSYLDNKALKRSTSEMRY